jgi:hypothetical protein
LTQTPKKRQPGKGCLEAKNAKNGKGNPKKGIGLRKLVAARCTASWTLGNAFPMTAAATKKDHGEEPDVEGRRAGSADGFSQGWALA